MNFKEYQEAAKRTAKMDVKTTEGRVELVLGLSNEVGSVSRIYKHLVRDGVPIGSQTEILTDELGDALWYIAMIANSMNLELDEIAYQNLRRTQDRYALTSLSAHPTYRSIFDLHFPDIEKFPTRMLFRLEEVDGEGGLPHVRFSIEGAEPNAFPHGAGKRDGKPIGFEFGEEIGNVVNDNAVRDDGYRFHDAVHIAFMTVLGWSPVMRALLRLKRKSNAEVDRVEDGARARDLEEALSAVLKELSESRNQFAKAADIDGEVRDIIRKVVANLEVSAAPLWLWVEAIVQGYAAMNQLRENHGGWLVADRDQQKVTFSKERPEF